MRRPIGAMPVSGSRLFADGLSSWLIRRATGDDEWAVFDRPAGSERIAANMTSLGRLGRGA